MNRVSDTAAAMAAISICENLLAVLLDRELLSPADVEEMLSEAAESVRAAGSSNGTAEATEEAAQLIVAVMDGLVASSD